MTRRATALASAGLVLIGVILVINRRGRLSDIKVGALYSVEDVNPFGGPSEFLIAKVLAVDSAVHGRLYKQRFRSRPIHVDEGTLTVGAVSDRDPGIGHMPLSRNAFEAWRPRFLQASAVLDAELDGYREWQKSEGGVWK